MLLGCHLANFWMGGPLPKSLIRVLVVEDFERWRRFYCSALQNNSQFEIVGEASDGLEAVHQARQLQPELILLDIGLPTLDGIETARQIREVSPGSKILFVSENRSADIVGEALSTGAGGYIVKSDAASALLPAINAVLEGKRFVSATLMGNNSSPFTNECDATIPHRHEVAFYRDDTSLVDGYARCIKSAMQNGDAIIVVVTESHRASLVWKLDSDGLDVAAAIAEGTVTLADASDALSSLIVDDMPEPIRCSTLVGDLVERAAKGIKRKDGRVVFCGGIAPILLSNGNVEGAIQLEHLWDEITRRYGVHTLCGYVRSSPESVESSPILKRICAEHSAVHGLGN
jgi:DNA-binding NarL/FixJ family response regulator